MVGGRKTNFRRAGSSLPVASGSTRSTHYTRRQSPMAEGGLPKGKSACMEKSKCSIVWCLAKLVVYVHCIVAAVAVSIGNTSDQIVGRIFAKPTIITIGVICAMLLLRIIYKCIHCKSSCSVSREEVDAGRPKGSELSNRRGRTVSFRSSGTRQGTGNRRSR